MSDAHTVSRDELADKAKDYALEVVASIYPPQTQLQDSRKHLIRAIEAAFMAGVECVIECARAATGATPQERR